MRLRDLGEDRILREIIFPILHSKELINEDAIRISINEEINVVVNIDTFVESTDAPSQMPYESYGYKTVVMASSDVLSKGALPKYFIASISVPGSFSVDNLKRILMGIKRACDIFDIFYLGGDLNESKEISISGVSIGLTRRFIPRRGLKPGFYIYTTGKFGLTGAALHFLLKNGKPVEKIYMHKIMNAFYYPLLKVECLDILQEYAVVAIDSSDGLARSLNILAEINGIRIDVENIPIAEEAIRYADRNDINPIKLALYGGEEFEIVFGTHQRIERINENCNIFMIGKTSNGEGVYYRGDRIEGGFEHF